MGTVAQPGAAPLGGVAHLLQGGVGSLSDEFPEAFELFRDLRQKVPHEGRLENAPPK